MADPKTKKPAPPSAIEDLPAVWVDPKTLVPWAKNPQKNVDAAVKAVMLSLQRFGQGRTIVARRANREVIAGHKTLIAAINLGWKRIAVRFVDLSAEEAHALAVADNKTAEIAEWDDPLLAEALAEIKLYDAEALAATGFSEAEIDKLVSDSYLAGEHALGRDGASIGDKPSGDGTPPEVTGGGSSGEGGGSASVEVGGGGGELEEIEPFVLILRKEQAADVQRAITNAIAKNMPSGLSSDVNSNAVHHICLVYLGER